MDATLATLTALLLDPFLTFDEAQRQAVATPTREAQVAERPASRKSPRRVEADRVAGASLEF